MYISKEETEFAPHVQVSKVENVRAIGMEVLNLLCDFRMIPAHPL